MVSLPVKSQPVSPCVMLNCVMSLKKDDTLGIKSYLFLCRNPSVTLYVM